MVIFCLVVLVVNIFIITLQLTTIIDYLQGKKQND